MKKIILLFFSSFLFSFFFQDAVHAQKAMKQGDEFLAEKAYAVAAEYFKKDADKWVISKLKWGRCAYMMKEVKKCTEIYASAPLDSLKDVDRYYYADALWQIGNAEQSKSVGSKISNPILKDVIMNLKSGNDSLEIYSAQNVKVDRLNLEPEGNSFGAYWAKGQLYYVASAKRKSMIDEVSASDSSTFLDIKMSGSGVNELPFNKINTSKHEGSLTMSPANDRIIITRTINKGIFKSMERPQLFELTMKKNGKWSRAKHLPFCEYKYTYAHASFASDGKSVYFVSDQPGGKGGFDIYSVALNDKEWGKATLLAGPINSTQDELFPTCAYGNIFFSSNRSGGLGAFDIYSLEKETKSIVHLPAPINSSRDDFSLVNNGNDSVWFVSSNRNYQMGKDEILKMEFPEVNASLYVLDKETGKTIKSREAYVVKQNNQWEYAGVDKRGAIPPYMNNGDTLFVHGYFPHAVKYEQPKGILRILKKHSKNELTPIHNVNMNLDIPSELVDRNGKLKYQIRNLNSELKKVDQLGSLTATSTELPFDLIQEGDSIEVSVFSGDTLLATAYKVISKNNIFRASSVKVNDKDWSGDGLKNKGNPAKRDSKLMKSLKTIYFATNKWFISPAAKRDLNEVVAYLKENPTVIIECAAHADCRNSREYNLRLSENRAKSSADYLIRHGVERARVKYKGYGEDFPLHGCICEGDQKTTCDDSNLALDRRTEFIIVGHIGGATAEKK
jgi:outer membrane protein OmpA-like peptidoglycan-associated protein